MCLDHKLAPHLLTKYVLPILNLESHHIITTLSRRIELNHSFEHLTWLKLLLNWQTFDLNFVVASHTVESGALGDGHGS
jgi:hypothetical protein